MYVDSEARREVKRLKNEVRLQNDTIKKMEKRLKQLEIKQVEVVPRNNQR